MKDRRKFPPLILSERAATAAVAPKGNNFTSERRKQEPTITEALLISGERVLEFECSRLKLKQKTVRV
ncbi:uncharacterized protein PHALS_06447 [Plasmopara halstedii]|uniref:Uncharacterized protein n=1 Tax=Plasmopara halstedii TaxID=4781 RepID=A0A0N7L818_PLAHL|nr:uncharacterized protein PHALS_06447 [Plasmopara halstedii]CEG48635.1 hypothetical protein PHALS_06447 [Plasmopara halstedii]|eukprot:XP_024585004.1 hypothetical protein PHALS_06447 [Plasmopara halstedii]